MRIKVADRSTYPCALESARADPCPPDALLHEIRRTDSLSALDNDAIRGNWCGVMFECGAWCGSVPSCRHFTYKTSSRVNMIAQILKATPAGVTMVWYFADTYLGSKVHGKG